MTRSLEFVFNRKRGVFVAATELLEYFEECEKEWIQKGMLGEANAANFFFKAIAGAIAKGQVLD